MLGWKVIPRIGYGPVQISPHGIGIAFGYFLGSQLFARRAARRGLDENHAWNIAAWSVVGAIAGARIAYVIGHLDDFASPIEWLKIWEGGISIIGGLIGGIGLSAVYILRRRLPFWDYADAGAPGLSLGIFLGRSGDLLIGDHLGRITSGWWGWTYKGGELISPPPCTTPAGDPVYPSADGCIEPGLTVHQTAIYDSLWSLAIVGVLYLLERRGGRKGHLFLAWAALYALGRIATDFLRVDKTWIAGLTGSQMTSIVALVFVSALAIWRKRTPEPDEPEPDEPEPDEPEPEAASEATTE